MDGMTKRYLVSVEGCWRALGVVGGEEVLKPLADLRQILSKDTHMGGKEIKTLLLWKW